MFIRMKQESLALRGEMNATNETCNTSIKLGYSVNLIPDTMSSDLLPFLAAAHICDKGVCDVTEENKNLRDALTHLRERLHRYQRTGLLIAGPDRLSKPDRRTEDSHSVKQQSLHLSNFLRGEMNEKWNTIKQEDSVNLIPEIMSSDRLPFLVAAQIRDKVVCDVTEENKNLRVALTHLQKQLHHHQQFVIRCAAKPALDVSAEFFCGSIPVSKRMCGLRHIQEFQCLKDGGWYKGDFVHGMGVTKGACAERSVDICEITKKIVKRNETMYSLRLLFDNTELHNIPSTDICDVFRFRTGDVVVCRLKNRAHPEAPALPAKLTNLNPKKNSNLNCSMCMPPLPSPLLLPSPPLLPSSPPLLQRV